MLHELGFESLAVPACVLMDRRIPDEGRSFMAETQVKKRPHIDFARRLLTACDGNPHVPAPNFGRLRWFEEQLLSRFGITVTREGVRKWFDGVALPRTESMHALAQLLEVDLSWLSLGTSNVPPREQKLRNAEADGAVNLVAGLIQMSGANPAFPAAGDARAATNHIDIYAIIRGAQYAIHVAVGSEVDGGFKFSVPIGAQDCVVIGVVKREGFAVDLLELDSEGLIEHGKRKGGTIDLVVNPNYRTENHTWRQIKSFAERL